MSVWDGITYYKHHQNNKETLWASHDWRGFGIGMSFHFMNNTKQKKGLMLALWINMIRQVERRRRSMMPFRNCGAAEAESKNPYGGIN